MKYVHIWAMNNVLKNRTTNNESCILYGKGYSNGSRLI